MKPSQLEASSILKSQRLHLLEAENASLRHELSQSRAENQDLTWQLHEVRKLVGDMPEIYGDQLLALLNGKRRRVN